MKGAIWLSTGTWGLVFFAVAFADPRAPADLAPWHLNSATITTEVQPDLKAESSTKGPGATYLEVQLRFRPELAEHRLHQFRVVDKLGKTVANVHGFYRDRSVLVFEGEWKDLGGLYLEGLGHREPLVPGSTAARAEPSSSPSKAEQAEPPAMAEESPWDSDSPGSAQTGPTTRATEEARGNANRGHPGSDAHPPGPGRGGRSGGNDQQDRLPGGREGGATGKSVGSGGPSPPGPGQTTGAGGREVAKSERARGLASLGPMGASAGAGGGIVRGGGRVALGSRPAELESPPPTPMILYLSCADALGKGRIYQVDEFGSIRGLVTLPYAATGLALHHRPSLVAVVPRAGGKIFEIDSAGRVSVILENDPLTPQPVDVGIVPGSDAILVADRLAHVLATTSMDGRKASLERRFPLQKWQSPWMCVAVATDKKVLYSTDIEPGVYRFALGDDFLPPPLLARPGGVAADRASARWAAVQPPGQVAIFEGESPLATLRLPPNRGVYRHGLLSFAAADRLVLVADAVPATERGVFLVQCKIADGSTRDLFVWGKEEILDLVVGPRMPWPPYEPDRRHGLY